MSFEIAYAFTARWEGGWSDHSDDPGGETMLGVTWQTYREWRSLQGEELTAAQAKDRVRGLEADEAADIYRTLYWNRCRCGDLPAGIAVFVFDTAVNQGVSRAGKFLQKALVKNGIRVAVDGAIGPQTVRAVGLVEDRRALLRDLCVYRLMHYTSLVHLIATFGFGWRRRAVDCAIEGALCEN